MRGENNRSRTENIWPLTPIKQWFFSVGHDFVLQRTFGHIKIGEGVGGVLLASSE